MSLSSMFDKTFLKASVGINEALGKVDSTVTKSGARSLAKSASNFAGRTKTAAFGAGGAFNNGGFAVRAGLGAAAGGAAGYAYDGTDGSAMKGALLGAGGAAGYTAWKNPALRGLGNEAMSAGKSAWGDARGWAGNQYKRQVNAMHVREAGRAGWTQ